MPSRNNACPEDVGDNSNKYVTGNVEYEIGPPQLPQQIGARATVINTVHRGAESSLPTFTAEEIDSMNRLTLKGHLIKGDILRVRWLKLCLLMNN